jgi:hypothetical protein
VAADDERVSLEDADGSARHGYDTPVQLQSRRTRRRPQAAQWADARTARSPLLVPARTINRAAIAAAIDGAAP